MSGLLFARFFPSDWRSGASLELNLEEEGLYIRCCAFMWDTGKPVPGDETTAARIFHLHPLKYRKVMSALIAKGKMIRAQGVIFNERVQEEIDNFRGEKELRSERAKAGHQTRKSTADKLDELTKQLEKLSAEKDAALEALAQATQGATPQTTPPITPHTSPPDVMGVSTPVSTLVVSEKPSKNNETNLQVQSRCSEKLEAKKLEARKDPPTPQKGGSATQEKFETFWSAFPAGRKRGKGKALEAFKRIVSGTHRSTLKASTEDLIAGARRYAATRPDPEYVPMPTTWLNEGRWLDDGGSEAPMVGPNGKPWGWWEGMEARIASLSSDYWRGAFAKHPPNGTWPWWLFGPPPGGDGCLVPEDIVREFGYAEIYRGSITHDHDR